MWVDMNKALLMILCIVTAVPTGYTELSSVLSQAQASLGGIIIEGADHVANKTTEYSTDLIDVAENVSPRIVVEYGDSISELDLNKSSTLNAVASAVAPRIIVEYADFILGTDLERPSFCGAEAGPEATVFSGELVTFNGSGSYDLDGTIVSYTWDFDDGAVAEGKIVEHRFRGAQNEPKTYTVTLTAEDDNGMTGSDTLLVTVKPLKKHVQLKPTYIDVHPSMEVTYNWVGTDEATGEDLYIISQIDTHFGGIMGGTQFFILRRISPPPSWPKVIWHIPLPTEWRENTRTYTEFDDPTWWQKIWGTPCEPTKRTFPDGIFEGIEVTETSLMFVIATGAEITIISIYWDAGWVRFDPSSPPSSLSQEQLKEMEELREVLELLDKLLAVKGSPGELRVYDSEGRVAGLVNGEIKEDIPGSAYTNGSIMILYPNETYRYEVVGIDNGTYKLLIISVENADATTFTAIDIPTSSNAIHQYTIDWDAFALGEEGVTVMVDSDGDGVFEHTFASDSELTQEEFMLQFPAAEAFPLWIAGAAIAMIAIVAVATAVVWRRRKQPARS